jgi:hypothetical protein
VFQLKRWAGAIKKVSIPEAMAIFKRENFLNIGKKRNSLAIKSVEKKGRWLTNFRFFLPHYGKMQTTNPKLRSLRLGTSIESLFAFLQNYTIKFLIH